jgi:hypothetical protein
LSSIQNSKPRGLGDLQEVRLTAVALPALRRLLVVHAKKVVLLVSLPPDSSLVLLKLDGKGHMIQCHVVEDVLAPSPFWVMTTRGCFLITF